MLFHLKEYSLRKLADALRHHSLNTEMGASLTCSKFLLLEAHETNGSFCKGTPPSCSIVNKSPLREEPVGRTISLDPGKVSVPWLHRAHIQALDCQVDALASQIHVVLDVLPYSSIAPQIEKLRMVLAEAAASTAHPATATPISTSSSLSNANVTWPSKNLSPLVTEVNRERVLSPVQHQYVSKLQEGIQSSGRKDTGATALLVSRLRQQRERSGGISPSPSEGIITQGSEPRIFAKQVTDPSTYRPLSPFQGQKQNQPHATRNGSMRSQQKISGQIGTLTLTQPAQPPRPADIGNVEKSIECVSGHAQGNGAPRRPRTPPLHPEWVDEGEPSMC